MEQEQNKINKKNKKKNYSPLILVHLYTLPMTRAWHGFSQGIEPGGGVGGRDEVWDRETMFSQFAKRSPCAVVSG